MQGQKLVDLHRAVYGLRGSGTRSVLSPNLRGSLKTWLGELNAHIGPRRLI